MIDLKKLVENGVQFGHQTWRWSPLMAPFIWGKKNGVHLIDISKTAMQLEKAQKFLEEVTSEGKQVLWVGTKKAAQGIIKSTAERLGCPYAVNRWVGGTLTNFSQVKKSVTKLLHFEDVLKKSENYSYTKKEFGTFQKLVDRLQDNVGGVRTLAWPVGAVIVVDAKKEATAIREAATMGVPIVALVDTIGWPSDVYIDYLIPGNDDAARAIKVIIDELAESVARGMAAAKTRKTEAASAANAAAPVEMSPDMLALGAAEIEEEEGAAIKRPARGRRAPQKAEGLIAEVPAEKEQAPKKPQAARPSVQHMQPMRRRPLAETKPADGVKPEAKPEVKPVAKPEVKLETQPDAKPAVKEVKTETSTTEEQTKE